MLVIIQMVLRSALRLAKSLTTLQDYTRLKCKCILAITLLKLKCCTACCRIWCTQASGISLKLLTTAKRILTSMRRLLSPARMMKALLLVTMEIMPIILLVKKLRLLRTFIRARKLESACRKLSAMITATSITTTCLRVGRLML